MKMNKQPLLEAIAPALGSSFSVNNFAEQRKQDRAAWHFHPEIELVYVDKGSGKRHIGNPVSYYSEGDLVLIGSNVPHFGFTDRLTGNSEEVVIQFNEDFLGPEFFEKPEMSQIKKLFKRGKQGIVFYGQTKEEIGKQMSALTAMTPLNKLTGLLNILEQLSLSDEYELLNIDSVIIEAKPQDNNRLELLYDFVNKEYTRHIPLAEAANMVSMTEQAFSRFFKKKTGKTFTQFVNEHRLVHASRLLAEEPMGITDICYDSGFNNFSHFNKLFKKFSGKSPSQYRNEIQKVLE
ncbi:AraC family transcriptional regulator [Gilvibacter sp.]|uniref:AraC family transcriptional regulator n=1 Tax=Gilvibacter sp. TaxID=2729997 RepID=UPI0025C6C61E|nr:helix-turn-helix transcriptional regulator [Gilvibacter sp.]NQX78897.1 helix-turn-helix domain-containing protein [Gilvibacter sp.]